MERQRPINLNLATIQFPLSAIVSILHRISGLVIFLGIPVLLFMMQSSLESRESFILAKDFFHSGFLKFIWWIILTSLGYHIICGARHILMDFGIGESKRAGKLSAKVVIILAALLAIGLGVWLW